MSKESEIREAIQRIAQGAPMKDLFFPAIVLSVQVETCTIKYAGLELDGVRIGPVVDGDEQSIAITPETGSMVLVADMSEGLLRDLAIIRFSKIKKAVLKNIEIEFNGGENGGLAIVGKIAEEINKIKDSLNSAISVFNAHVHTVTIASLGTPTPSTPTPTSATPAQPTDKSKFENTKITH